MKRIFLFVFIFISISSFAQTRNPQLTINPKISTTSKQNGEDKDAMQVKMTNEAKIANLEKSVSDLTNQVAVLQTKLAFTETKLTAMQGNLASGDKKVAVFQVTASPGNLFNLVNGKTPDAKMYQADAILIDNPACDGNPNAIVFITQNVKAQANAWGNENSDVNGGGTLYAVYSPKFNK